MAIDIRLPEIGEGIESGDVLEVLVREGDVIAQNQDIVELETDKATMGVPSPHAGRVVKVHVKVGQTVPVGAPLITLEPSEVDAEAAPSESPKASEAAAERKPSADEEEPVAPAASSPSGVKAVEQPQPAPTSPEPTLEAARSASRTTEGSAVPQTAAPQSSETPSDAALIPAGPAIRRFAREVGVDLSRVVGTGPGGRITREDVLAVVREASRAAAAAGAANMDPWGPIRVEKLSRIRKTIAAKMHESWSTVPRVTNFDDADITELEQFRQESKADYAALGIKLTTLPFVVKAVAMALKSHPLLNASLDLENDRVIFKQYINIGIAVDTDRGLIVPSLRDADKLSIPDIARQIVRLSERVRQGDFTPDDLRGSTFTVSNLGAIGGTYSTPIINVPEVAILLVGRARKMPVVVGDQIAVRLMMPLSLSYDHRLVDGAAAARFLNDVIAYLKTPSRLLLAP